MMNNKELSSKIQDLLVLKDDDGIYHLFGKYIIIPTDDSFRVSKISEESDFLLFSSLKNAVTWCVFDKNKKYKEIKRIYELDHLLSSLDVSIAQHEKLIIKRTKTEDRYIYMAKLNEEKLKKKAALKEINEFASISKYWQTKKFIENKGK